jgi:hypothetical protein
MPRCGKPGKAAPRVPRVCAGPAGRTFARVRGDGALFVDLMAAAETI